ncbi:hypothetical protein D5S18_14535 [Nocardia panacis]|uniref:Thiamine-binding protein domain-containing protein n=1 Tax=Nocardia panacis TaxID=2340916 RepID=A0A3A4KBT7_9NOCA|nr:hypothetical protein [Nocardia panacis]RJO75635.1 hypothetical protein D5S18_14535 [Nocardia panacis]
MRMRAEFTTEPFHGEGDPPPHATAALRVAESLGLTCDFGPLGTAVAGRDAILLPALGAILAAAFDSGATGVTLRVERD